MERLSKNLSWHVTYLEIAKAISLHSKANKKKVGAILVKDDRIISIGYNGTPSGFDNTCEEVRTVTNGSSEFDFYEEDILATKPEVLHAESNCITKCAKSNESSLGSILYTTMSPCFECAKLIIQSGIIEVYYSETYRDVGGISLLGKANIPCYQI